MKFLVFYRAPPGNYFWTKLTRISGRSRHSSVTFPEFFGQTGTCMELTKALSGKFSKFVPPDTLKMHSPVLSVLRFLCNIFPKLLRFKLRNTHFVDDFYEIHISIEYSNKKICMAINLSELRSDLKRCNI